MKAGTSEVASTLRTAGSQEFAEPKSDNKPLDSVLNQLLELQRQAREHQEGASGAALLRLQRQVEETVRFQSEVIAPACQCAKVNTGRIAATMETLVQDISSALLQELHPIAVSIGGIHHCQHKIERGSSISLKLPLQRVSQGSSGAHRQETSSLAPRGHPPRCLRQCPPNRNPFFCDPISSSSTGQRGCTCPTAERSKRARPSRGCPPRSSQTTERSSQQLTSTSDVDIGSTPRLGCRDVVNTHPGLTFLREAAEFHTRYITTVIQRIFYTVNRSWTGRITCTEIRKSNLLQNLALLEEEEDINQLTEFFSYEHFYVIYCKFWELDTDHDLYIDQKDLARHNDDAISGRMIERIFSGAVTRHRKTPNERKIGYADFVWFLISEEDKKTSTSIEYWFRCMDLDGDGVLSMYELNYFYEDQCKKLECMSIEPLPFEDCLCQLLDLVKPECEGKITLHDLKRCKMANVFFDTLFNIGKYLEHEQKDPFSIPRQDVESDGPEMTDWEKYALQEYENLVAEETANENWNDGDSELSDY
ncbi:serine/threonine-protein phosphatase 2A regulatory subunit B'' subunit beta isoform X2 [Carcharodon carcharias]|uniref:serine/threonine-protein phosphatase 2A regulatory subunit B'' subunit beta isoform X2 n=1 Tax=Carcharodon carcharias TaxID=13397 RepID=UPI001B7DD3F9|nr:serine/threonine-protein phosphatase 2A regulatory subunit B'' subunit beta isoform X2 [Carcharodon carcharias]